MEFFSYRDMPMWFTYDMLILTFLVKMCVLPEMREQKMHRLVFWNTVYFFFRSFMFHKVV